MRQFLKSYKDKEPLSIEPDYNPKTFVKDAFFIALLMFILGLFAFQAFLFLILWETSYYDYAMIDRDSLYSL